MFCSQLWSQDSLVYLNVKSIRIEGNDKTQERIILREMTFHIGDTIQEGDLDLEVKKSKEQLIKTRLFADCQILIEEWTDNDLYFVVNLVERWYTFPIPQFKLADRNFNVWWTDQNRSLDRVTYGIKFTQENVWGLNHQFRITALTGYRQNLGLRYRMPYFNKSETLGASFSFGLNQQRETSIITDSNKQVFHNSDRFIKKTFAAGSFFRFRNALHYSHSFSLGYNHVHVSDTILQLNENYLLNGGNNQDYFQAVYSFNVDFTDNISYPLSGFYAKALIRQRGLGIFGDVNIFAISGNFSKYTDLSEKWYVSNHVYGITSFPQLQPYNLRPAAGFGERYVRGYELYVVDGHSYFINRNNIKFKLFDFSVKNLPLVKVESIQEIPFKLYLKVFGDVGYVWDDFYSQQRVNAINNTIMSSYGVGVDVVSFYDISIRFEYAFNRLSENGLFLHLGSDMPSP